MTLSIFEIKLAQRNSTLKKRAKAFFDEIEYEPNALHVVIHDEAHYGVETDSEVNQFFPN
jgi:hypothetical protein